MGHCICALVLEGPFDERRALDFDLQPRIEHPPIAVFPIDHYFTAYWAARLDRRGQLAVPAGLPHVFPTEAVVLELARAITGKLIPRFAMIMTEYLGGAGEQWAVGFEGERRVTTTGASINDALLGLGVVPRARLDAWDTIGLAVYRRNPDYLDRYVELCEQLGL